MAPDPAHIVLSGMAWLPWLVLLPAIVLLWFPATRIAGLVGAGIGYALALGVGQLQPLGLVWVGLLAMAGWAVVRGARPWIRWVGHAVFLLCAIALRLHVAPGFANPVALEGVVSAGAAPFKAYLNLDKTLSGLWILGIAIWGAGRAYPSGWARSGDAGLESGR